MYKHTGSIGLYVYNNASNTYFKNDKHIYIYIYIYEKYMLMKTVIKLTMQTKQHALGYLQTHTYELGKGMHVESVDLG